jgi:hypothetical protein
MSSSHPKNENGLPLRWPICMASSTSMSPLSPEGRSWTRTNYTWMTVRSSTSAHSTSLGLNPPPITPIVWCTGIPKDAYSNSRRSAVSLLKYMSLRGEEALGPVGGGHGDRRAIWTTPFVEVFPYVFTHMCYTSSQCHAAAYAFEVAAAEEPYQRTTHVRRTGHEHSKGRSDSQCKNLRA